MEYHGYILHGGQAGERQLKRLEKLLTTPIHSTRYIDENCLYSLGIYHSVFFLLDKIGMHDIFATQAPTYPRLTFEFLSSLIYNVSPNTASTVGGVKFRMFNVEYDYSTDGLAAMLGLPYGDGAICEAPLDTDWAFEAFWARITKQNATSFDGLLASHIHNPALRVFRFLLASTIFARENPNKVNAKELIIMQSCLTDTKVNPVPFMIAHMHHVLRKGGPISFGGLITTIARAIGLDTELATLEPLPPRIANLKFFRDMRLCKTRKEGGYFLMVGGAAVPSVVIPCTRRTDIRFERNWTYDLNAPAFIGPLPPNLPLNEGNHTDDEYDFQTEEPPHFSPPHTTPSTSNPHAGTAPSFHVTEDMWREHMAREAQRDTLLATLQQQAADNMAFMQASQEQNASSLRTIMESQLAFQREQHLHQTTNARHFQLMEATQGTLIGRTQELQAANAALSERLEQLVLDRDSRRRSRSRRSGRTNQDGEGPSGPH